MDRRYEVRQEPDGSFTVMDGETGVPAASDGQDLTGLSRQDARDIADMLNRELRDHRSSPLV